ncbi:MAG: hypothetical protein AAF551_08955 [Bacteroidota bacterium]
MKKITFVLFIVTCYSCLDKTRPRIGSIESDELTSVQIDSILNEFQFNYENPIVFDSLNQIIIPISTKLPEIRKSSVKSWSYSDDYPRYWNVLFYNSQTDSARLLTDKKFRISDVSTAKGKHNNKKKTLPGKILYVISDQDYNEDQTLNFKDPDFLFVSEIDGTKLQRISPLKEKLVYYEVIESKREILLRTMRDVNEDKKFDKEDEPIWYVAKLESDQWKLKEIVDSDQRQTIKTLYFNQWLKKKPESDNK